MRRRKRADHVADRFAAARELVTSVTAAYTMPPEQTTGGRSTGWPESTRGSRSRAVMSSMSTLPDATFTLD